MDSSHRIVALAAENLEILAASNFTGAQLDRVVGRSGLDFIAPEYREAFRIVAERVLTKGGRVTMCFKCVFQADECWAGTFRSFLWHGRDAILVSAHRLPCAICKAGDADWARTE